MTKIDDDYFDVEPIEKGVHFEARRLHRDELPEAILASMVFVKISCPGTPVEDYLGKMVAPGVWELQDSSLRNRSDPESET